MPRPAVASAKARTWSTKDSAGTNPSVSSDEPLNENASNQVLPPSAQNMRVNPMATVKAQAKEAAPGSRGHTAPSPGPGRHTRASRMRAAGRASPW